MKEDSTRLARWGGYLLFAIIVIASIHRETLGIQLAGLLEVIVGLSIVSKQRISYGWRGRPAKGQIAGIPAVLLGVAATLLGIYSLLRPAAVAAWGRHH